MPQRVCKILEFEKQYFCNENFDLSNLKISEKKQKKTLLDKVLPKTKKRRVIDARRESVMSVLQGLSTDKGKM